MQYYRKFARSKGLGSDTSSDPQRRRNVPRDGDGGGHCGCGLYREVAPAPQPGTPQVGFSLSTSRKREVQRPHQLHRHKSGRDGDVPSSPTQEDLVGELRQRLSAFSLESSALDRR